MYSRGLICWVGGSRTNLNFNHLRMARQVLGCPASAAVERLFSKATRVYSKLCKEMDGITLRDVLMSENLSFY